MTSGIEKTFQTLHGTKNRSANAVLVAALSSPDLAIRRLAVQTLLERCDEAAHHEVLIRWHLFGEELKEVALEHPGRMTKTLRNAAVGKDEQLCGNALDAILWTRDYDLLPLLVNVAISKVDSVDVDQAARVLLELARRLYEEVAGPRDYNRRDPQLVRCRVVTSLAGEVDRFARHQRLEIIEAFLILAGRENATLRRILQATSGVNRQPVIDTLTHSTQPGVMRLLCDFLEDRHAPLAARQAMAARQDPPFLHYLFHHLEEKISSAAIANIQQIDDFHWIHGDLNILDAMSGPQQAAAVRIVDASGSEREDVFRVIQYVLEQGAAEGRQAATEALRGFEGYEANRLILQSLDDESPEVQAMAIQQLRDRKMPGIVARLIGFVDSPHAVVRKVARESLPEFRFDRFLVTFDSLDEERSRSTGRLVRKIDPTAIDQLKEEMAVPMIPRKQRAIEVAEALGVIEEVEPQIIELLQDTNAAIRIAAAKALRFCNTTTARSTLREALLDRRATVRTEAEASLKILAQKERADSNQEDKETKEPPAVDASMHGVPLSTSEQEVIG